MRTISLILFVFNLIILLFSFSLILNFDKSFFFEENQLYNVCFISLVCTFLFAFVSHNIKTKKK